MSTCQLEPCIELPLSEEKLKESVDKAKDWALIHGNYVFLLIRNKLLIIKCMIIHLFIPDKLGNHKDKHDGYFI